MLNIFKNQERYAIIKYVKLEQKENPIKRDKSKAEKKRKVHAYERRGGTIKHDF